MRIDLTRNLEEDTGYPIGPVRVWTCSLLSLELRGIPRARHGVAIERVDVTITNADGLAFKGTASRLASIYYVRFSADDFARYGEVANGVAISLVYADGSVEQIAAGQLIVVANSANAKPGDPTAAYVQKGDDLYVRTSVIEGVQHYCKQTMTYDSEMEAWGADWTGDYILVDGEFVEANKEVAE